MSFIICRIIKIAISTATGLLKVNYVESISVRSMGAAPLLVLLIYFAVYLLARLLRFRTSIGIGDDPIIFMCNFVPLRLLPLDTLQAVIDPRLIIKVKVLFLRKSNRYCVAGM